MGSHKQKNPSAEFNRPDGKNLIYKSNTAYEMVIFLSVYFSEKQSDMASSGNQRTCGLGMRNV
jgi:hypothetical protein